MPDELLSLICSNRVGRAARMLAERAELGRVDLFTAVACGEVETVRSLLANDPERVRAKGGPMGCEPLLYACFSRFLRTDQRRRDGIVACARLLLDRGADANASYDDALGGTEVWAQPCIYGAAGIANDAELTTMLLDTGATIADDGQSNSGAGAEALYHATEFADPTCLRLLLEHGNPHKQRVDYTIGRATDFEFPEHVALFLQHGADPNYRINWNGLRTQLHKAVYLGRSAKIVRMMIEACGDVNARDAGGVSVLKSAVQNGNAEVIELLKSHGAADDSITEMDAKRGAPITLCLAAARNDVATIDRLIDAGADVEAGGGVDDTPPLHWATWRGRLAATQRLVERGADIHRHNTYGGDALGAAIHGSAFCFDPEGGPGMKPSEEALHGDYPQILEYLIAKGATLPKQIWGGSEGVREVLRERGVPKGE